MMPVRGYLITGGSGFFGQAFVRHLLATTDCDRICIYSRGEHRQAEMRQALGDNDRLRWFIGDVRDRDRLRRAMAGCEVVVHAAALKRIEVGYYNPVEMVNTNVLGAINVVEAARDARVAKVVALSTDKAYQPVSAYGYSKALAESIFLAANDNHGTMFAVTRYGNVAGSDGSVIQKWRELIKASRDPFPITAPECTRFWMMIKDAVQLVSETIEKMHGGELVVPSLWAYAVGDLAEAMDSVRGWDVRGLPAYEKMHESMEAGKSSEHARRMSIDELREALKQV